ncbi:hypothetical protein WJX72_007447 [[Myrmecia] bisecta]|uniref:BTB domain-containing protein n=1 Tax=[Myrmecia] bisecta TaxID=41462 RepID=A0AAW1PX61_9CHLO
MVAPVEGSSPERAKGIIAAYAGELYLYGGLPRFRVRPPHDPLQRFAYPENEGMFMKLGREAGEWEKVQYTGAMPQTPSRVKTGSAGAVHDGKLWVVGNFRMPTASLTDAQIEQEELPGDIDHDSIFTYCFRSNSWVQVKQHNPAPVRLYHRIAFYGNQLLMFGGEAQPFEPVAAELALWSFNLDSHVWTHVKPSGDLPHPKSATAFEVWNDAAYCLTCNLQTGLMEVSRLDLRSYIWKNLGSPGCAPTCRKAASMTVMQDQWVMYGGVWDGQTQNDLYVYDLVCERWSLVKPSGTATSRYNHMALAVNDMLFLVGGLRYHRGTHQLEQVTVIERLWQQPVSHIYERHPPAMVNCGLTSNLARMYDEQVLCDVDIEVEGMSLGAHRAVLAAASPVFHSMFSGGFSEGTCRRLTISGLAFEAMDLLLRYIYGCLGRHISGAQAFLLFQASDKYAVEECQAHCVRVLKANITVQSVFDVAQLAYMHQCDELLEACVGFAATVNDLAVILGSETSQRLLDDSRMQILHWFSSRTAERSPRKTSGASCTASPPRFALHSG